MASIKDVAMRAGVAVSTVSKVLNHYPNISQSTRQKVNAAIEELGFVPNAVAAALSSKRAGRIALLIHLQTSTQAIDEISMQYLAGALESARTRNLDVVTVFFSMLEGMGVEEIIGYFRSQSINGIIIYGISKEDIVLQELIRREIFRIVLVDAPLVNNSTSCVWIDQAAAQYAVAEKTMLMDTIPYEKVLYIAGKSNGYVTEERIKGMERFAKNYGLKMIVQGGEFSERRAREITIQYAEEQDMIVCASDLMAIGAMRALMDMDIFRPVCGFDGLTLMGYVGQQMNTVRQDFARISREAVEELGNLMKGGGGREVVLDYALARLKYEEIIR
ncbi:MAG: LacI family transcriptional regulator [bacterium]|nr:LacI family transcriptional regulator [bacterium]MCM1373918.1 LacI family transcriptional regulator [Muribaculum sp.]